MEWFKMRSDAPTHWKIRSVGYKARWLWQLGLALAARYETDGALPRQILESEPEWRDLADAAEELVAVNLWEPDRDGWKVHDWADHNETRDHLAEKREAGRERVQRHRAKTRENTKPADNPDCNALLTPDPPRYNTVSNGTEVEVEEELKDKRPNGRLVTPAADAPAATDPDPAPATQPEPKPPPAARDQPNPRRYPPEFEQFWAIYPNKRGKPQAFKAWKTATLRAAMDAINAAASRYRDDPHREQAYTQRASTWLQSDGWEDPPLPDRRNRASPSIAERFAARARQLDHPELEGPP
jgi:hypothetical protein